MKDKPLYTIGELAELFQISKPTIYDWTRHGKLKPIEIRGRVYFLGQDIQQLLKADIGSRWDSNCASEISLNQLNTHVNFAWVQE
jgi:excisionase family DNA binding protein